MPGLTTTRKDLLRTAENSHSTQCLAAALADMAQRLVDLHLAIGDGTTDTPETSKERGRATDIITERLTATVEFASHVAAQSAKGALFQVVAISDMAFALSGCVSPSDDAEAQRFENAIRRLAHSVAAYLEQANEGLRLEDVAGGWFMNRQSNPHHLIEIAKMRAGAAAHRQPV